MVIKDEGALAQTERLTCYTNEITAGVKAEIALRDLGALNPPASLTTLLSETEAALHMMVKADLESACGPAMTEPKESKDCDAALGARYASYQLLDSVLDKWAPYL